MWPGGIHDSGTRPINSSSRRCRASAQSVFGRFFGPPQTARLRRLRQVHPGADPLELLDHKPPARGRLQRNLKLPPSEPREEPPDAGAVRRRDPPTRHLAGREIDPLRGDLRPMLIEPHHDRQPPSRVPLHQPFLRSSAIRAVTRAASSPTHCVP